MLEHQAEAIYYPKQILVTEAITRVLCLAPHPDDEVLGCGGLLAHFAKLKCTVQVLIFSGGESATGAPQTEHAVVRRDESRRAAQILGLKEPTFLDWPDRGVRYGGPLISEIQAAIERLQPQYLLLPSLSEPHPDHQAIALAGIAASQQTQSLFSLLFYEVGAPIHPNVVFDITAVADLKWQAIQEFSSQLSIQPYEKYAAALACVRAFGCGPGCAAAEAFFKVDALDIRENGASAALPFWPSVRDQLHLANTPQQLPLVSILIRSMDRFELADAVASVAAQTYQNIEMVIVNASGRAHGAIQCPTGRFSIRVIEPSNLEEKRSPVVQEMAETSEARSCDRAQAANIALRSAKGEMALFLDDDDVIAPTHIEKLVERLLADARDIACYTGVRVVGGDGRVQRIYDIPWSWQRIIGINFLPIHAVLFRIQRTQSAKLKFDETLPVLEDWDFWRKMAALGGFAHCPGVSADYRQGRGNSGIGDALHPNHWKTWHSRLLERDLVNRPMQEITATLAWHAIELDSTHAKLEQTHAKLELAESSLEKEKAGSLLRLQQWVDERDAMLGQSRRVIDGLHNECLQATLLLEQHSAQYALLESELKLLQRSRSWKITRPLRTITRWLERVRR